MRLLNLFICLCLSLLGCKDGEKSIQGAVKITPELASKVGPSAALYVIARPEGMRGGPPLAVKKLSQPFTFPVEFTLTAQDLMMPEGKLSGNISVSARLSQSGSAMPANPGDLEGVGNPNPSEPGKGKVEILLDKVRE